MKRSTATYLLMMGILHIFWEATVLMKLWNWFAHPILGLPFITLSIAIGFELLITTATDQLIPRDKDFIINNMSDYISFSFARPAFYLLIGWIATKFI